VLTTGDGGGLMAIADLESAVRRRRPRLAVIWNDAAYGAEVNLYGLKGLAREPMLIPRSTSPPSPRRSARRRRGAHARRPRPPGRLDGRGSGEPPVPRARLRISGDVIAYQEEIIRVNS
jgi:hypothetical protein